MEFKRNLNKWIVPTSIIVFIITLIIWKEIDRKKSWSRGDEKYTIGIITDYITGSKTPNSFEYIFPYNGEKIKSREPILSSINLLSIEDKQNFIGRRYYVRFLKEKPKYSELFLDKPVPDSIVKAPDEGWSQLPE